VLRPCKRVALVYQLVGRGYPVHLIDQRRCDVLLELPVVEGSSLELLGIVAASRAPFPCASEGDDEGCGEFSQRVAPATMWSAARRFSTACKQLATLAASHADGHC
jgi:hypothetical protein